MFTENEGLKDTLAGLVPILDDIKQLVIENKGGLRDMVTYGLTLAIDGFATLAKGGVVLVDTLFALMEGYKRAAIALDEFNQKITPWETSGISDRIAEAKTELAGIVQMREQFAETGTKIFSIAEAAQALAEEAGKSNYQQEQTAMVMDDVTISTNRATKAINDQSKALQTASDEVAGYRKEIEEYDRSMGLYEWSGNLAEEGSIPAPNQPQNNTVNDISGLVGAAGSGNVSAAISSALSTALPGIGSMFASALGPVMDMIVKGNREDMDQFFQGIADQVTSLAEHVDDFVLSLISNADEIIVALEMLPTKLVTELVSSIPDMITGSITGVWDGIKGFFGSVVDTFKNIGDSVAGWFRKDKDKEGRDLTSDEAKALVDYYYQHGGLTDREYVQARQGIDRTDQQIASDTAYIESLGMNKRAFGGPVTAGESYIVGDGQDGSMRNAEVFTPNKSGTVSKPTESSGGGLVVNIQAAANPHETAQMVTNAVKYLIDSKKWRFDPIRNMAVA
jgi:hypothetical protein